MVGPARQKRIVPKTYDFDCSQIGGHPHNKYLSATDFYVWDDGLAATNALSQFYLNTVSSLQHEA